MWFVFKVSVFSSSQDFDFQCCSYSWFQFPAGVVWFVFHGSGFEVSAKFPSFCSIRRSRFWPVLVQGFRVQGCRSRVSTVGFKVKFWCMWLGWLDGHGLWFVSGCGSMFEDGFVIIVSIVVWWRSSFHGSWSQLMVYVSWSWYLICIGTWSLCVMPYYMFLVWTDNRLFLLSNLCKPSAKGWSHIVYWWDNEDLVG